MKESNQNVKWVSDETQDVIDTILSGTTEQAEEVLKRLRGYKPIPGINMMTGYMVSRLSRGGIKKHRVCAYAWHTGVPHATGKWETDLDGIISISKYLREAGIDCEPSAGMKLVGCGPRNSRVNLYDPRGVLAILYACAASRSRIDGKVRAVYGLETVEVIPAPQQSIEAVTITPEFAKFLRAIADAIEAQNGTK